MGLDIASLYVSVLLKLKTEYRSYCIYDFVVFCRWTSYSMYLTTWLLFLEVVEEEKKKYVSRQIVNFSQAL